MSEAIECITRANIDDALSAGWIEMKVRDAPVAWWPIRRNGSTKRWRRDKNRISIPVKAGLDVYYKITQADFLPSGALNPARFRIKPPGV